MHDDVSINGIMVSHDGGFVFWPWRSLHIEKRAAIIWCQAFVSFSDLDLVVALRWHEHRPVCLGRGPLRLRESLLPCDA